MKTTVLALIAFALVSIATVHADSLMSTTPNVNAGPSSLIGVEGGAFWLQNVTVGAPNFNVSFKYSTGSAFTLPAGIDFANGAKVFLTVGHYSADYSSVIGNYGGQSQRAATYGSVYYIPIMANASYSFYITKKFHFDVNAGLGTVYGNDSFSAFDDPVARSITFGQLTPRGTPGPTANFGGIGTTEWSFGYQASAGFAYDFTDMISLNIGYRYLHVNHNVSVNGNASSGMNGQMVEGGLTMRY